MDQDRLVEIITEVVREQLNLNNKVLVPVGVSARHLHL